MSSLDLDINNYNLDDILRLFKVDYNFNEDDIKNCYKTVLKLHPDKSGLDKEYFLFYTKAFKVLKNVYEYKNKRDTQLDKNKAKVEYLSNSDDDEGKKLIVKNLQNEKGEDFNKWFNETFEKINISNLSENGYGDWLKSENDTEDLDIKSVREMHDIINKKKESLSALVKIDKINEMSSIGSLNELDNGQPESYSASVFSKLAYDDVKIAHTETVIPVSNNDYEKIQLQRQLTNSKFSVPPSDTTANRLWRKTFRNLKIPEAPKFPEKNMRHFRKKRHFARKHDCTQPLPHF